MVGLPGAVVIGLGSILGTGVFVSLAIAADVAGAMILPALVLAALVALCNGLSSAQLAAAHPMAGGTYAYGYRFLHPVAGFTAGWMFLWAKSASAATAALGFAGYVLHLAGGASGTLNTLVAIGSVALITVIVLSGLRRTTVVNTVIVGITVLVLLFFVVAGTVHAAGTGAAGGFLENAIPRDWNSTHALMHATALLFVAYTGYGRIATLGEEVREPRRVIPIAVLVTLGVTLVLYLAVAGTALAAVGEATFAATVQGNAAPLEIVASMFDVPGARWVLAVGAVAAMLGVLLNLLFGLSRVLVAMGRQGDMPQATARLNASRTTPVVAVLVNAAVIAGLCLVGDVKLTWSFSAFTVLVYYALTNLAALRIDAPHRLYPKWIAVAGLIGCLGLAFWVQPAVWLAGLGLVAAGLLWHMIARRLMHTNERTAV